MLYHRILHFLWYNNLPGDRAAAERNYAAKVTRRGRRILRRKIRFYLIKVCGNKSMSVSNEIIDKNQQEKWGKENLRYYISDPHFFHAAQNTKMDQRGFESVELMNQYMLERWNQKVHKNDEVVILGDLSWGKAKETNELLEKLHGRLYLIQGNHDRFLKDKAFNANRFVWIKPYEELQDNKRKVVLSHYPIMCYNGQYRVDEKGNPKVYMLYGHVHDTQDQRLLEQFQDMTRKSTVVSPNGNERNIPCHMINCFCMYSDYTPLTLDEWIECDRKRRELRLRTNSAEQSVRE